MRRPFNAAHITRAAIGILLLTRVLAYAQDVTEASLKAAFIYSFARFTEWPADAVPATEPMVMCVVGGAAIVEALERAVTGRMLDGRPMAVSVVQADGPRGVCHVLYLSRVTKAQAARVIAGLRGVPVLTLSDVEGFTELGGIAQFFFEHGQLRFTVHIPSAKRARLQISSRLLALATRRR